MREIRYVTAVGRDGRHAWRRKYRGVERALAAAWPAAMWGEAIIERHGQMLRHVSEAPKVEDHAAARPRAA
jgi:hypothetical protein